MVIHQQRGRASAGPRDEVRALDVYELSRQHREIIAQPASPERSTALARLRGQMRSIRNRVRS